LPANPTPAAILRHGRQRFLAAWQPRQRCGQWRPQPLQQLYALAQHRIGLIDPYRLDELAITALAHDLADALAKQQLWLDHAMALLAPRPDFQLLMQLPRSGAPTAAAILTAIGDIHHYGNGQQRVKLAGLDVRLCESGSSIRRLPKLAHVGSASLRHWLYHYALRLVAHDPHFRAYSQRRKQPSPGKGAGQRALMAVCDKTIRMISRILTDHAPYDPQKDKSMAEYYAAQRKAASIGLRALEGVRGEGKPGCAFGPRRDGETPSVRAGPAPLHETRTKNRRSTPTGKPASA
jgi:Transposase IS116/IS110/IS902 family